jgi:6-phosphogluconolactonase
LKRMKREVRIFKDLEELSRAAADLFVEQAGRSIADRNRFLVALNPPADPGSSYGQARDLLLSRVPIPDSHVHQISGELDPVRASEDYSLTLKGFAAPPLAWPRFDLVYLGMGEDGHTASLFPESAVDASTPVIPVQAHYQDRPAERVTLTPLVFNSARNIVFMATGEKKAQTLAQVLSDRYNPELYPAQRIQPDDGRLIWLVDQTAASRLPRESR